MLEKMIGRDVQCHEVMKYQDDEWVGQENDQYTWDNGKTRWWNGGVMRELGRSKSGRIKMVDDWDQGMVGALTRRWAG